MRSKKILLSLIILSNMFLTGCPSGQELNKLAIVTSIGIDKAENGYLMTFQIINPKAIASKKSVNESPFIIYTETGKDLFLILRRVTTQSPRKIYNSHLRTIIFGEEMAREGIQETLGFFVRDHEYRTDFYFLIAKGTTANNLLSVITPLEQVQATETYDSLETSAKVWAPTKTVKIFELVNDLIADGKEAVLIGVDIYSPVRSPNTIESLKRSNPAKLIITGLGAFKKGRLVGWLNEDDSRGYNYITGNVKDTAGFIQYDDQDRVSFEVTKSKTKLKAKIINGKPAINVEIMVNVNVTAVTGNLDVVNKEINEALKRKIEEKIAIHCNTSVEHVKNDLHTDIFGFGEEIHRTYPKLWQEIKDNWDEEFVDLPVNIKVHAQINNLGETTKSIFSKGSK